MKKDSCTKYLNPFKKRLIVGPIFKLIEAIFELIVPILMARIIDIGIKNSDKIYVYKVGAIIIILGILGLGSSLVCQFNASRASQGYGTDLRNAIFTKINKLSPKELDSVGSDALINIMTNDVNQLQLAVAMLIRLVVRAPFLVIGSLVASFIINYKVGFIFLALIVLISIILYVIIRTSSVKYTKVQNKLDDLSVVTSENLKGSREVRGFAMQDKEEKRFTIYANEYQKEAISIARISSLLNPLTSIVTNFAIIAILYFGGKLVSIGELTQGEVIALVNYMNQILLALIVVSNLVVIFTKAFASLKRCDKLLALETSIKDGELNAEFSEEDVIKFDNVTFAYGDLTKPALENLNFIIKNHSTVGIIGSTGSGKSTIVQLIERFYDPTEGTVELNGKDLKEYSQESLRKSIGMVHQKAILFKGTIRSNLLMANPNASEEEMLAALKTSEAIDFVNDKGGLDAEVEENGRNFSGGQKQRLNIAIALVKQPKLLILDDSTSALDYITDAKVRKAIKEYSKNMTSIIISQRASSIKDADEIIVLDDGKIQGIGTHHQLLENCPIYQAICASQENRGEQNA